MDVDVARSIVERQALDQPAIFYGSHEGLSLGAGLIIGNVQFPFFNEQTDRFQVVSGPVYVLSHECDLDPANERLLNDMALICPIVPLETFLSRVALGGIDDGTIRGVLANLVRRRVSRAVFMPPVADCIPEGGLLYLNQMASTAVGKLRQGNRICAVSAHGLQTIDFALRNHLGREKAEALPLERATIRHSSSIRATSVSRRAGDQETTL